MKLIRTGKAALFLLVWTGALTIVPCQQVSPSIDDEIIRLRRELAQTQLDCQRTGEEIQKDRTDNDTYKKRTAERMTQARRQLDTLASEIKTQSKANDSLAAYIASIQAEKKQIELAQDEFRRQLITLCSKTIPLAGRLPPLSMTPVQSALSLLSSDLSASSIDNNEGFSRLSQILGQFDESTGSIQISQENSPSPDIRGMAYRLRIGSLFEAVVDPKGERCSLFAGWNADGSANWKMVASAATAREILNAVNIREGKMLPAFVNIPFESPSDSVVTGGGK